MKTSLKLKAADLTVLSVRVLPEAALVIPWMKRIRPAPTLGKITLPTHLAPLVLLLLRVWAVMVMFRFVFVALCLASASCLRRF